MTDDRRTFVVDIPADFTPRFANVLVPRADYSTDNLRFYLCVPADGLPADELKCLGFRIQNNGWRSRVRELEGVRFVSSTSKQRPRIMPGQGTAADIMEWGILQHTCETFNFPPDWLMRDRHLRAQVTAYDYDNGFGSGRVLALDAVQVCDLSEGHIRKEINRFLRSFKEAAA
jgi:hypothetical protein